MNGSRQRCRNRRRRNRRGPARTSRATCPSTRRRATRVSTEAARSDGAPLDLRRRETLLKIAGSETKLTFIDGFDAAIVGLVDQYGMAQTVVLYDPAKMLDILIAQGVDLDTAVERVDQAMRVWLGEDTPAFAMLL